LAFYLIEGAKVFGIEGRTRVEGKEPELFKIRIFAGLALKLMLNEHKELGGKNNSV